MSASQSGTFNVQEFTDLGAPLVGGRLYTYAYGTTTQKTAYTDHAGTIPHTYTSDGMGGQYIALNSRGEVPGALYLSGGSYDLALKTAAGATVWTRRADPVWDIVNDLSTSSGASLVGYLPAGTGAVATTVQAQLRECVSVTGYDTLQSAVNTGKDVYIPSGVTVTSSQVTITTAGQKIYGSGPSSIIKPSSAGIHLFNVQADYVSISDLRLNGVETGITNTTFAIFTAAASPANYMTIERVVFSGANSSLGFANGVKFDDSCSYGVVKNCRFERLWGTTSGHGYGVLAGNTIGVVVESNWFIGTSGRGRHAVYFSAGATACKGNFNYVAGFGYEALTSFSQAAQPACVDIHFIGNQTYNCCTSIPGISTGHISAFGHQVRCKILGNTISGSKGCGIKIDGTNYSDLYDTEILSNTIVDSDYIGIDIVAGVRGILGSNSVKDSSKASVGTYSNIRVAADPSGVGTGTTGWLVSGNKCPASASARSAFQFNLQTPYPTNISLKGNMFESGVTSDIENFQSVNGAFAIDGRLRFSQAYDPVSIANGASLSTAWTVYGAAVGDIVTLTHSQNTDGCALYGRVDSTNSVTLTIVNNSGAAKDIASGTLYINVWKSSP